MKYSTIYNEAAKLIEKGWNQETYAEDERGVDCDSNSKNAVSWCVLGALSYAAQLNGFYLPQDLVTYLEPKQSLANWNDDPSRTQEQVVKLLKDAATQADEEGKVSI